MKNSNAGKVSQLLALISLLFLPLSGCYKSREAAPASTSNPNSSQPTRGIETSQIIERYRAVDNSRDSTVQMRARITSLSSSDSTAPRDILLTTYRKHEPNGRLLIFVEFASPAEERDRDGLITVFPEGRIEALRYVQSTDSFIVTSDPTSEDALFGLSLQELADGQPEKYDFTLIGDDSYNDEDVYRLDGKLKPGAESKFPRLVLLISKRNYLDLLGDFYDNHNELVRSLTVSKTEEIAGHWTRMRWFVENRARQRKIDFEALSVKYDQNLNDSIFTREHLKKLASK